MQQMPVAMRVLGPVSSSYFDTQSKMKMRIAFLQTPHPIGFTSETLLRSVNNAPASWGLIAHPLRADLQGHLCKCNQVGTFVVWDILTECP